MATAGSAWFVTRQGYDISSIGRSTEVTPHLGVVAAFLWGSYRLVRAGSRREVLTAAAACAIIGTLVAAYIVVRAELGFAKGFPNGGVANGWAPGAARAEFLSIPYLVASVQTVWGLAAGAVLLAISALKRSSV